MGCVAAAFLALRLVPFVGEKVFQRREQERAKPSALGVQAFEIILGEEPREECLCEIFGVLLRVAAPTHIGVEREPIRFAKFLQRVIGLRRVPSARREHDRPMRRGEDVARRAGGLAGWIGGQDSETILATDFHRWTPIKNHLCESVFICGT